MTRWSRPARNVSFAMLLIALVMSASAPVRAWACSSYQGDFYYCASCDQNQNWWNETVTVSACMIGSLTDCGGFDTYCSSYCGSVNGFRQSSYCQDDETSSMVTYGVCECTYWF